MAWVQVPLDEGPKGTGMSDFRLIGHFIIYYIRLVCGERQTHGRTQERMASLTCGKLNEVLRVLHDALLEACEGNPPAGSTGELYRKCV